MSQEIVRVKIISGLALCGSLYVLTLSCNQGQLSGSAPKSTTKDANGSLVGETDSIDADEGRKGDEPQGISGAFLTCALVSQERTSFPKDDSKEVVGCALVRANKKVNLAKNKNSLEFKDLSQKKIPSPEEDGPQYATWHRYGQIPRQGLTETVAHFTVSDAQNPALKQRFTFPMVDAKTLKFKVPDPDPKDPGIPGVSFMPTQLWEMSQGIGNLYKGGIDPTAFCTNGVAETILKPGKYESVPEFIRGMLVDTSIHPATSQHSLTGIAFVPFAKLDTNLDPLDSPRCAIEGGGCLFVKSVNDKIYIFDAKAIAAGANMADLLSQTRASLCKD